MSKLRYYKSPLKGLTPEQRQLVLLEHFKQAKTAIAEGNYRRALNLLFIFAFVGHGRTTSVYKDIQDLYRDLAERLKTPLPQIEKHGRIRLGYLTEGFDYTQAPVMNLINFVKYADHSKFDISIYSRIRPDDEGFHMDRYEEGIKQFTEAGAKVYFPSGHVYDRVIALRDLMLTHRLDILDSYVMYTIPACFLLCALQPAHVIIKECWQQPEHLWFPDVTIHATKTTLNYDSGKRELLEWRWPKPKERNTYTRKELGLPESRPCIAVIGRPEKFSSKFYEHLQRAVLSCGRNHPVVGIIGEKNRSTDMFRFLGFHEDIVDVLRVFDFCIDTFPLGGAKALADATFAGLPVVTFESSENERFRVEDWTMPEVPDNPLLTIPRWEYLEWEAKVRRLATDKEFLDINKAHARARARELGNFNGYMRRREQIYVRLYNQKIG